ncbi:uncharacterized protein TrAFT101_011666 [Trichoderma asperellum]|uniref:uncharacterized protein n=1 Tax=Trichoderma asperellum TaxID=101201 RepID=UPI00332060C8|nr:hypothetical protein TrAFT101_011666 [Trichoderma asperellum]
MELSQTAVAHSRVSCHACRHGKRRCNRVLPTCELCMRKEVRCSYPKLPAKRSYTPEIIWDDSSSVVDDHHPQQLDQPPDLGSTFDTARAVQFLAPKVFRDIQLEIPPPYVPVPSDVAAYVGDTQQVRDIAAVLFSQDASWLPIVCRNHFFNASLNPLSPRRAEGTLLALCMKLYCTTAVHNGGNQKTALYKASKRYLSDIEAAGLMSLHVLQATIFIALYEIGHAIYPAAYLTVGACARYGIALGLDKLMTNNSDFNRSWMEIEEKRRSWWAVLALDRFLNFGDPSRRLATSDPEINYYLPVDDQSFLDGDIMPPDAIPISAAFHLKTGSFARLAQATYLTSQALRLAAAIETPGTGNIVCLVGDTEQLRRTLEAQVNAAEQEHAARRLSFCCQTMFSYCGIFLLQHQQWQQARLTTTRDACNGMFPETRRALEVMGRLASALQKDFEGGAAPKEGLPIFFMQTLYQATTIAMEVGQGKPDKDIVEKIHAFRWLLQYFCTRWNMAKIYLEILHAKEAFHDFDSLRHMVSLYHEKSL